MPDAVTPQTTADEKAKYYVPPFSVGELLVTSLEAFLTSASLHLGEAMDDGRKLEHRNPMEAWMAIMGATALLVELAPLLTDEFKQRYYLLMAGLLEKFAAFHPDLAVPTPVVPVGTLRQVLQQDADQEAAAAAPRPGAPATGPLAKLPLGAGPAPRTNLAASGPLARTDKGAFKLP